LGFGLEKEMRLYSVDWQSVWTGTPYEDMVKLQEFCDMASSKCNNERAIEVGTHTGASAALMSEWFETVICIDPWGKYDVQPGELIATYVGEGTATIPEYRAFFENMERLKVLSRLIPIVGTVEALNRWPYKLNVALAFVDDGHTYHDCSRDIKAVIQHLHQRGILVCHDYYGGGGPCGSYIGVEQAVEEAIKKYDLEVIEHSGGIIALKRRGCW
jgi:hypothetical protein